MIYTPLRYPGGKTKLYSKLLEFLPKDNSNNISYAEPFAGGCGAGLKMLIKGDINKLYINDYDKKIYAFWYCILEDCNKFIKKIKNTPVNIETWKKQKDILKNSDNVDLFTLGFATFYLNRTNFSGVIKGGPIGGIKQEGNYKIDCRFNKERLIQTIENIAKHKKQISLHNLEASKFINYLNNIDENIFVYLDPPYYKKADTLYMSFFKDDDHVALKEAIQTIKHKWILSYDNQEFITNLYKEYKQEFIDITYTTYNKTKAKEVLVYV